MRISSHVLRLGLLTLLLTLFAAEGCTNKKSPATTLQLWHFWSEPNQQRSFEKIVHEFEALHPDIHIECTPLQWSDGKAKLQTAFAAHTAPDIIHIGLEWVPEFASAGVLDTLPQTVVDSAPPALAHALRMSGMVYALPWVMNCRAVFVRKDIYSQLSTDSLHVEQSGNIKVLKPNGNQPFTIDEIEAALQRVSVDHGSGVQSPPVGINAYEPHNVLKKTLPFLWSSGSSIFQSVPLSASVDAAATHALERYVRLCQRGRVDASRRLDEAMSRSELALWETGMWSLQPDVDSTYAVLSRWPVPDEASQKADNGWSILSGDCFAVSHSCAHKEAAELFLRYLKQSEVETEFCADIPDAGFPVHAKPVRLSSAAPLTARDSSTLRVWHRSHNVEAFYEQCLHSRCVVSTPNFLEAEAIFEEQIMQAVYGRKTAESAMADMKQQLRTLEQSQSASAH